GPVRLDERGADFLPGILLTLERRGRRRSHPQVRPYRIRQAELRTPLCSAVFLRLFAGGFGFSKQCGGQTSRWCAGGNHCRSPQELGIGGAWCTLMEQ